MPSSRATCALPCTSESTLDTGAVSINMPTSGRDVRRPFGGLLDSGSVFKERALAPLRFCARVTTVAGMSAR